MTADNFERMIALAEGFFGTKNDPTQISVNESQRKKLQALHPATMWQRGTREGPVVWILVVPTLKSLMEEFIAGEITEVELLDRTPLNARYETVYLCSALVLPEFRRKGFAKRAVVRAIRSIQRDHPVRLLFYWSFSEEGEALAKAVAKQVGLPVYKRVV